MPGMTETWAIRIFQAIRDADDDGSYPRMPKDDVLRGMLESGLQRQHRHDMRSLKAWIRGHRDRRARRAARGRASRAEGGAFGAGLVLLEVVFFWSGARWPSLSDIGAWAGRC